MLDPAMARFPRSWMCYCEDRVSEGQCHHQWRNNRTNEGQICWAAGLTGGIIFITVRTRRNLAGKYAPFAPHTRPFLPSCDITVTTKVHLSAP